MHQRQDEPLSERREHHAGEQALRHRRAPRKVDPQADASQVREQREQSEKFHLSPTLHLPSPIQTW